MNPDQTCGTCGFCCQGLGSDLSSKVCRKVPPSIVALPTKSPLGVPGIQIRAFYPPVNREDVGCGEYKVALQVEKGNGEDQKETPPKIEGV